MTLFFSKRPGETKAVSVLAELEARSALDRLQREGLLVEEQVSLSLNLLHRQVEKMVVQVVDETVMRVAGELVARHHLRPLDAMQCASAMVLREARKPETMRFVASDHRLLEAAAAEGFPTWDPSAGTA